MQQNYVVCSFIYCIFSLRSFYKILFKPWIWSILGLATIYDMTIPLLWFYALSSTSLIQAGHKGRWLHTRGWGRLHNQIKHEDAENNECYEWKLPCWIFKSDLVTCCYLPRFYVIWLNEDCYCILNKDQTRNIYNKIVTYKKEIHRIIFRTKHF